MEETNIKVSDSSESVTEKKISKEEYMKKLHEDKILRDFLMVEIERQRKRQAEMFLLGHLLMLKAKRQVEKFIAELEAKKQQVETK